MIKFYFFFIYFFPIVFINFKYSIFHVIIEPPIFGKIFNFLITNNYCTPTFRKNFNYFQLHTIIAPPTKFFIFPFFFGICKYGIFQKYKKKFLIIFAPLFFKKFFIFLITYNYWGPICNFIPYYYVTSSHQCLTSSQYHCLTSSHQCVTSSQKLRQIFIIKSK